MQKTKTNTLVWLTESAIMIALATVLSLITLVDLPYGGSVTPGSMLPMILIAYRYGIGRGCITGLANGVIQLFWEWARCNMLPLGLQPSSSSCWTISSLSV